jgi:hypothetical protein
VEDKSDPLQKAEAPSAQRSPPVAEREPLEIVVVDVPPAEVRVRTYADVEVPAEAPRRRWPFGLLMAVAIAFAFSTFRMVFEPLVLRLEHGVERRVVGERSYEAPRPPQSKWRHS